MTAYPYTWARCRECGESYNVKVSGCEDHCLKCSGGGATCEQCADNAMDVVL